MSRRSYVHRTQCTTVHLIDNRVDRQKVPALKECGRASRVPPLCPVDPLSCRPSAAQGELQGGGARGRALRA